MTASRARKSRSDHRESPGVRGVAVSVAALYVDPKGPYPKLLGPAFCWDEKRDARTYQGRLRVIAHPPCGPWGRLHHLCHQDRELAIRAVAQVRAWGGILEHPADSKLWPFCNLPRPGETQDRWGGRTFEVRQVEWGHACEKRTWLYCVRCQPEAPPFPGRAATHCVSRDARRQSSKLLRASPEVCRRTPPLFAEMLIRAVQ